MTDIKEIIIRENGIGKEVIINGEKVDLKRVISVNVSADVSGIRVEKVTDMSLGCECVAPIERMKKAFREVLEEVAMEPCEMEGLRLCLDGEEISKTIIKSFREVARNGILE